MTHRNISSDEPAVPVSSSHALSAASAGDENRADANTRRDFLRQGVSLMTGAALMGMAPPGVRSGAWAAGSDAPEKKEVRIGFIPLTDCSSVVMAAVQKFDEKYGIKIIPSKEASWAAVRDKLVNGELDAAHVLYGLVYGDRKSTRLNSSH